MGQNILVYLCTYKSALVAVMFCSPSLCNAVLLVFVYHIRAFAYFFLFFIILVYVVLIGSTG